jgi:hypothetical protein
MKLVDDQTVRSSIPRVTQHRVIPEKVRSLDTFDDPGYIDHFTVEASKASDHSPEEWLRVTLENSSATGRFLAWQVGCALRLEKEPSPDYIVGWRIADSGDDWLRLEATSWFMTAHIVTLVEDEQISISLFIHYDRSVGKVIWTPLSKLHQRLMPGLLRHGVRMMRKQEARSTSSHP